MKKTQKVIENFGIIGLNTELIPNDPEFEKEKIITNLEIYYGYIGTDLEHNFSIQNEQWLDLDGQRNVWLKISYDQVNFPPITHMEFLYFPYCHDYLKIPTAYNLQPVPVKKIQDDKTEFRFDGTEHVNSLFKGYYDLTQLLDGPTQKGLNLVLCFKVQSEYNQEQPLSDIEIGVAEKKRKPGGLYAFEMSKREGYEIINFAMGKPEKNRQIMYKKKTHYSKISFTPEIYDKYPQENFIDAVSMFCFPQGIYLTKEVLQPNAFSFILTKEDGARIYGTCLQFSEPLADDLYNIIEPFQNQQKKKAKKQIYSQKAICLISQYPFMNEMRTILKQLYRQSLSMSEIPIERMVCNIVNDIVFPQVQDRGDVAIEFDIGFEHIKFNLNMNYPYISEESITNLFRVLKSKDIILIFQGILLERKICIISRSRALLTQVAEALIGLIFPFVWSHVLIPILPDNLKGYLEAPVPFIIGLNINEDEVNLLDEMTCNVSDDYIKAYLDSGEVIFVDSLPPLPEKGLKQLVKRMAVIDKMRKNKDLIYNLDNAFEIQMLDDDPFTYEFNAYEARDAFFEFICSFLKKYPKCTNNTFSQNQMTKDFSDIFDSAKFLQKTKSQKKGTFLSKFIETTIFSQFIENRLTLVSSEQQNYFDFVDKNLKKKRVKKDPHAIKYVQVQKTVKCLQPNNSNLPQLLKNQFYQYENFPILNQSLLEPHKIYKELGIFVNPKIPAQNNTNINFYDDLQWAKFMLQSIYTIWFILFQMKINTEFNYSFDKLTDHAIMMMQSLRSKGILPNETIIKALVMACAHYDKQEKMQNLVQLCQDLKINTGFIHGAYIQALDRGKQLRTAYQKSKRLQMNNQSAQYNNEEEKINESQLNSSFIQININEKVFESKYENLIFKFEEHCPQCGRQPYVEEILSGFQKSFNEYTTQCPVQSCQKTYITGINLIEQIQEKKNESFDNVGNLNLKCTHFEFFSPVLIKKELENLQEKKSERAILQDFYQTQEHKVLLWNIVFYLKLIEAPCFILDWEKDDIFYRRNIKKLQSQFNPQQTIIKPQQISTQVLKGRNNNFEQQTQSQKVPIGSIQFFNSPKKVFSNTQNTTSLQTKVNSIPKSGSYNQNTKSEIQQNLAKQPIKKYFQNQLQKLIQQSEKQFNELSSESEYKNVDIPNKIPQNNKNSQQNELFLTDFMDERISPNRVHFY